MKSPYLRIRRPFCRLFILAVLTVYLAMTAAAQGLQPRPVARLLGEAISEATNSRPRVVRSTEIAVMPVTTAVSLDQATEMEKNAFEKTNEARIANGLPPLQWDGELCRFARAHSEEMALRGYFDHDTPEGLHLKDRAKARGMRYRVIAENIAYNKGYSDPGSFAVERWMKSPGHRSNILYVGFQAAGIGSYVASDGSVYLTQVFINR